MTYLHRDCFAGLARCPTLGCVPTRRIAGPRVGRMIAALAGAGLLVAAMGLVPAILSGASEIPTLESSPVERFVHARQTVEKARHHLGRAEETRKTGMSWIHLDAAIGLLEAAHWDLREQREKHRKGESGVTLAEIDALDADAGRMRVLCQNWRRDIAVDEVDDRIDSDLVR